VKEREGGRKGGRGGGRDEGRGGELTSGSPTPDASVGTAVLVGCGGAGDSAASACSMLSPNATKVKSSWLNGLKALVSTLSPAMLTEVIGERSLVSGTADTARQ